jgi:hypothetical protein
MGVTLIDSLYIMNTKFKLLNSMYQNMQQIKINTRKKYIVERMESKARNIRIKYEISCGDNKGMKTYTSAMRLCVVPR